MLAWSLNGSKIFGLVVDDDPLIRKVYETLLKRDGLEIESVQNGKEAIDLFLSGKTFDLIIMDMEMPVMDGIQATEMLRTMGVSSMIIGMTSCTVGKKRDAFVGAGLDACWEKPLNSSLVDGVLHRLTQKMIDPMHMHAVR